MTALREIVLAELAKGTHTEAFADGARWAVQQAEKPVCDSSWHAVGPTRAQPVCFGCQGTSKTITALTVLRDHRLIKPQPHEDAPECTCGGWEPETATRDLEEHEEHVAAMLSDRPLMDRAALHQVLEAHKVGRHLPPYEALTAYRAVVADAVLMLARPLPTRDQLAAVIHPDCTSSPTQCPNWTEALNRADAVLTLLNGTAA